MVNQGKRGSNRWGFMPIANYLIYKVGLPKGNSYLPNYCSRGFSVIHAYQSNHLNNSNK